MAQLSPTLRNFLLDVYHLSQELDQPSTYLSITDVIHRLYVSSMSLNRMIMRLKQLGLIDHQPYHGIRLTDTGRKTVMPWVRRYRIAGAFLYQVMELDWHEIQAEARALIGGMDDRMTQRMYALAGSPGTCPYGEPIPDLNGMIAQSPDQILYHAPLKTEVVITRVLAREPERLKYIGALRLLPGTRVQVMHVAPFEGPLQLKLLNEYRIIGHNLAATIYVRPVD
jgi:DtxR family Mn-dependent transcriptional regulator